MFNELLAENRRPVGAFVMSSDPAMSGIFGDVGYDFVIADMEHGRVNLSNLIAHIYAAKATGAVPLVRVPDNAPSVIQACLDMGAEGIFVPKISQAEDARRAVKASRYISGGRGKCPIVPASGFTRADWSEYSTQANREILVVPIIETRDGVENAQEICAVEGIEFVFFGHADLGQDMGMTPESDPVIFRQMWEQVRDAAHGCDVKIGAAFRSTFDLEADFVTVATDVGSVRDGAERGLERAREAYANGIASAQRAN